MSGAAAVTASAPGKVIVSGEYAVLEGAPALVMAVNRRVSVALQGIDAPRLELRAPGLLEPIRVPLERGRAARPSADDRAWDVVLQGFAWLLERHPCADGLRVTLDSTRLHERGRKLGLGSSAALAVAMLGGLVEGMMGEAVPRDARGFARARALHEAMQGSGGSGADVAASLTGGVIAFRNPAAGAGSDTSEEACIQPLTLPEELHRVLVWTGVSASTPAFLRVLADFKRRAPQRYAQHMGRLRAAAEECIGACEAGEAARCAARLDAYAEALAGLGEDAGLSIYGGAHATLRALAPKMGVAYKPCGAGGGDLGLACAQDPAALARFAMAAGERGCQTIGLEVDDDGLRIDDGCHGGW